MDFANDIALVSEGIKEAQEMLTRVNQQNSRSKHEYRENEIHELQYQSTV